MSDLVERLRGKNAKYGRQVPMSIYTEAADEIERLKAALRLIYTWNTSGDYQRDLFRMKDFAIRARSLRSTGG